MKEIKEIAEDIRSAFAENHYPEEFLAAYDQMECLESHRGCETFLVRSKSDGTLYLAKCYDRTRYAVSSEIRLLQALDHDGLPHYTAEYHNDAMTCVVREYIEGKPLDDCIREKDLTEDEVRAISLQLCDLLIYLHSLPQPVIHRDIKPSNIILRPDGSPALIDFDIARFYQEDSGTDTVFFGTRGYAPPEQYGFAQTDPRSDIYSFGVLLRYLLTGSIRANGKITLNPQLQRVIDRCTAFSPDDRYRDMREVKAALTEKDRRKHVPPGTVLTALLLALLMLVGGFCLGRMTDWFEPAPKGIVFREPLMEAAVRTQLAADAKVPLTEEMLHQVSHLYIWGTDTPETDADYYAGRIDASMRGNLATLEDLALLPNLEVLYIGYQGEIDISALAGAVNLRSVELKHCRVSDCTPLAALHRLDFVGLFDTDVTDVTCLNGCTRLTSLAIGKTLIASMDAIGCFPNLERLELKGLTMDSLAGIERMTALNTVFLQEAQIADLTALSELPALETVYADTGNAEALRTLLGEEKVRLDQ